MTDSQETNELLREIRDLLADREEQYTRHLEQIRVMYDEQAAFAKKEREAAIRQLTIVVAVLGAVLFAVFKLT